MQIIKAQIHENGSYSAIQTWNDVVVPDGYYMWPDELSKENFYNYNGFVSLNTVKKTVISYEPNIEAWNKWIAENPGSQTKEEATDTEVLNILLGVI